jgi:tetratricopeptide (TPR) repeat protein
MEAPFDDRRHDDRRPVDYDPRPLSAPPRQEYSGRDSGRGAVWDRPGEEYPARDFNEIPRPRPTSGGGVYGSARTPDATTTGDLPNVGDLNVDGLPSGSPFSVSPAGPTYTSAPLTGAGVDGLQATGYMPIVRPGAQGFPPELAALASTVPDLEEPPPEEKTLDPEQRLAAFVFNFDPDTLREQVEGEEIIALEDIRDQLTDKLNETSDNPTRARLLSLRAVVSRILGDLLKAFADAKLALAHAEATGELRRIAIAQARLAHVLQWREEFEEADRLLTLANSSELPDRLRATMHQHAGKCAYDQGRYMEACNHFESALDLRKEEDPELIAQTALALDAVFRRVAEKGWGPYPRSREEILQLRKPPSPAFDETTQRWGFIDTNFDFCIGPGYVDVQPFRDSVAWVQRQGAQTWELIDDAGRSLIDPAAGYLGVSSFSDGLAWVTRDGHGQWIAIDKTNAVVISSGFDDVRPFRRGLATVRRGPRWGAVDGAGRAVVPFQFDGFATALSDGRFIDGFSDEGLAIVVLGGLKGVVDRTGRVIVAPVHPVLMIHPVAFIIADEASHWGALDRRGRLIIDETFASRIEVLDEIDRLLADTRPVM